MATKFDASNETRMKNLTPENDVMPRFAWFCNVVHDLYYGLNYHGPYETEAEAVEAENQKKRHYLPDYVEYLLLPYITYNGQIFALWKNTATLVETEEG